MFMSKFYFLFIYFILYKSCEAADTKICATANDCVGGLYCVQIGGENICVAPCTVINEVSQCGGAGTCTQVKEIGNMDIYSCAKAKGCLTDNECKTADSSKPICNIYNLQCIADPNAPVTPAPTPKPATIGDQIVGGQFDCEHHKQYCNNTIWKKLMYEKCPATCGFIRIVGSENQPAGNNNCRDLLSDCAIYSEVCNNSAYSEFVKVNCRFTCGLC